MHLAAWRFILEIFSRYPLLLRSPKVLDCGSMNVSRWTTGREIFVFAKEYIGIDWRSGDNVDVVCLVHEYREKPDGYFHFILCTEMLEHDPYWKESVERMTDLLAVGGSMLYTMGGKERPEHHTRVSPDGSYYEGRDAKSVVLLVLNRAGFNHIQIEESKQDIYCFFGIKT